MKVITTFSEDGYYKYGKRCIDSLLKYWPIDCKIIIYTDFDLIVNDPRVVIKSFYTSFPEHKKFISSCKNYYHNIGTEKANVICSKTIKFSFKSFVISAEIQEDLDDIVIWVDADTETLINVDESLFTRLLDNYWLSCQVEGRKHVETGILIFNKNTDKIRKNLGKPCTKFIQVTNYMNLKNHMMDILYII